MRVGRSARATRDLQIFDAAKRAASLCNEAPDRTHATARFLIAFADNLQSHPPPPSMRPPVARPGGFRAAYGRPRPRSVMVGSRVGAEASGMGRG
jgi:hypothetical protein